MSLSRICRKYLNFLRRIHTYHNCYLEPFSAVIWWAALHTLPLHILISDFFFWYLIHCSRQYSFRFGLLYLERLPHLIRNGQLNGVVMIKSLMWWYNGTDNDTLFLITKGDRSRQHCWCCRCCWALWYVLLWVIYICDGSPQSKCWKWAP